MKTIQPVKGLRIVDARSDIREYVQPHLNRKAKPWTRRSLSQIKILAVHHQGVGVVTETTDAWQLVKSDALHHVQNNWGTSSRPYYAPNIAYHYVVTYDGGIYWVNDRGETTWHCKGANPYAIGIQLQGNFAKKDDDGVQYQPTLKQLHSLQKLLDYLTTWEHKGTKAIPALFSDVWGHTELRGVDLGLKYTGRRIDFGNATSCPASLLKYVVEYRNTGRIAIATLDTQPNGVALKDIDKNAWYAPYALACANAGIMRGYDDNTWKPEKLVSRAEMGKIAVGVAMHGEKLVEAYKEIVSQKK